MTLKTFEKRILLDMLSKLLLEQARQELGNEYLFGFDDVIRIMKNRIDNI